jgi:uncharacterized protein
MPPTKLHVSQPGRPEWPDDLDVASLRATGWRPVPFSQFILKVHGRCNLACDYCYVYRGADQTWRDKAAAMSTGVADRACDRIVEHATTHRLPQVTVVLHGGEPLLAPPALFDRIAIRLRAGLPEGTTVDLRVQTNGVSLSPSLLDQLLAAGYRLGISIDGDRIAHDRHRRYANGSGSHALVDATLRLLATRAGALSGLLCTVDLASDPIAVYDALVGYQPPAIDFLLPHGNWDSPPPGRAPDATTPYGDWLVAAFDRWYDDRIGSTKVRMFSEILQMLLGGSSDSELIGLSPCGVLVIETDGALEQVDTLKSAYHGAAATGLTVESHPFDACLALPAVVARQIGARALADTCGTCPVHAICGGGYYPHRYRSGTGFRNPSVFCSDLRHLIDHVSARVKSDVTGSAFPALARTP